MNESVQWHEIEICTTQKLSVICYENYLCLILLSNFCFIWLNIMLLLLRSESPSGKFAKLHTAATSNNRDHSHDHSSRTLVVMFNRSRASIIRDYTPWSLYYCLFAPCIYGCNSSSTSRSWRITHSTQRQWRGCKSTPFCTWSICHFYILQECNDSVLQSVKFCVEHEQQLFCSW